MSLVRWDPFRGLAVPDWVPIADVAENPGAYLVRVELPGLGPNDVKVSLESHVLSIAGERRAPERDQETRYHRVESAYGAFLRSFTLPDDADEQKLEAEFKDGVLTVRVPKSESARPRSIEIKAA
jgi:HSP20 family protein